MVRGRDFLGRVENSIEIKAPSEKVWEMLALDRLLEWQLGFDKVKSIEHTSEVSTPKDKFRAGATAHGIPKKQGESIKLNFKITENLENEKIIHHICEKMFLGTFTVLATFTLEPVVAGTKFAYVGDYEMPWGARAATLYNTSLPQGFPAGKMITHRARARQFTHDSLADP